MRRVQIDEEESWSHIWLDRETEMTRIFESKSDVNERLSFAALPMVGVVIASIVAFSTVTAAQNDGQVKAGLTTGRLPDALIAMAPLPTGIRMMTIFLPEQICGRPSSIPRRSN